MNSMKVVVIGALPADRVFSIDGIAPSIMAGTHGYGFGCILTYEEDTIEHH